MFGEAQPENWLESVASATAAEVVVGDTHACVLESGGGVRCWGPPMGGLIGEGMTSVALTPQAVHGMTDVQRLSAGQGHVCALRKDHSLWCWGDNTFGQLGVGGQSWQPHPTQVAGLSDVFEVFTSSRSTFAHTEEGLFAWGDGAGGSLGDAGNRSRDRPVAIGLGAGASQISGTSLSTCAVLGDGRVSCWGDNANGGLGDGTLANHPEGIMVDGLSGVRRIAMGVGAFAVRADGSVLSWGAGTLGDRRSDEERMRPMQVSGITGAIDVHTSGQLTCVTESTGRIVCWGSNHEGAIGISGPMASSVETPMVIEGLPPATAVVTGAAPTDGHFACAIDREGGVWCWGSNRMGQLGAADVLMSPQPLRIVGLPRVVELAAGIGHVCARGVDGLVYCWGDDGAGQLGDGQRRSPREAQAVRF
jgi:alpha-tubulin suppressor-like RCC1 family protein